MKYKDIAELGKEDKAQRLKELKIELIKKNVTANKSSKIKAKEIKKSIARILTSEKAQKTK